MCDLYLGANNARATTPPTPFWTNPCITSTTDPTLVFTAETMASVTVTLQNHDTAAAGAAVVDLWWADPTTGFALTSLGHIATITQMIGGANGQGDASLDYVFPWNVPDAAAATNGGHVCLAAVVGSTSGGCNEPAPSTTGTNADTTSPQVAIHNVHVNAAPPMPPPPPGPGIHRGFPWPFFFAATNASPLNGRTRLVARAYDPQVAADHDKIWSLAMHPGVRHAAGRCVKFAAPASVHLAVGLESVVGSTALDLKGLTPRLANTGPVHPALADHLVKRDWLKAAAGAPAQKEIDLVSRQSQQAAVWVEPHGHEGHVYAVEVSHELLRDGKPPLVLGGLTVVFVPVCRPW